MLQSTLAQLIELHGKCATVAARNLNRMQWAQIQQTESEEKKGVADQN